MFHRGGPELRPAAIELLAAFARSNSGALNSITHMRLVHERMDSNTVGSESRSIRLADICHLVCCLGLSGCRIEGFALDFRRNCNVALHAHHDDCRCFGTLLRGFFRNVNSFLFRANLCETSSLRGNSIDQILDNLVSVWTANKPVNSHWAWAQTFDVRSVNFFEYTSIQTIAKLCSMKSIPWLSTLHLRELNERSLCNLSQAVGLSTAISSPKKLKLSFLANPLSENIHEIIRKNTIFASIRVSSSSFSNTFHGGSGIPLLASAMASRTRELEYDIGYTDFTDEELHEAEAILHRGFESNKTLLQLFTRHRKLNGIISMYTSINQARGGGTEPYVVPVRHAKRRKLGSSDVSNPAVLTTSECIDVITGLAGKRQEDSARYCFLRSNPHIVPAGRERAVQMCIGLPACAPNGCRCHDWGFPFAEIH